jgi:mono/diheme cytochrome c family protein
MMLALWLAPLTGAGAAVASGNHERAMILVNQADERGAGAVARGRYIVEDVALCGRCHTPTDGAGEPDRTRWLMGAALVIQPTVPTADWAVRAPRLAGAPPGTDSQFVTLLTTGIARNGSPPRPPMPRFRMTPADAQAVLAYLKSLGGGKPGISPR